MIVRLLPAGASQPARADEKAEGPEGASAATPFMSANNSLLSSEVLDYSALWEGWVTWARLNRPKGPGITSSTLPSVALEGSKDTLCSLVCFDGFVFDYQDVLYSRVR